ncbi:MAG: hypothetical protein ACJ78Q_02710, partial [Chloroflexia bacterium]
MSSQRPVADDGREQTMDDGRWTMDDGDREAGSPTPSSIAHRPSSAADPIVRFPSTLAALLGFFVLAAIVTYPAISHFASGVPGDLIADRDQNLWNLWWVGQSVGHLASPFHTGLLYYPYGVSLYYHTLGLPQGLLALLPQLVWGLPAGYNTVLLAAFTLSGYGAYRLGMLYTGRPLP